MWYYAIPNQNIICYEPCFLWPSQTGLSDVVPKSGSVDVVDVDVLVNVHDELALWMTTP